jgi:cobalt/nickel transport system permease protein
MEYPEIDKYSSLESPIHNFDPRTKIITFTLLIFSSVFVEDIRFAALALIAAFILLIISKLPFKFIFNHVKWVSLFILPFLIIMPFTVDGDVLVNISSITITYEGITYGFLITVRAFTAILLVFTMLGTMRFDTTIKALHMLKIPNPLVQMLMFTYRYIFVFLDEFQRMWTAMTSKGFKPGLNLSSMSKIGKSVGMLVVKSYERAQRVYQAMLSKGYTGNPYTIVKFNIKTKDYLITFLIISFVVALHISPVVLLQ